MSAMATPALADTRTSRPAIRVVALAKVQESDPAAFRDVTQAESVVNEFCDSNSTLPSMPMAHSMAYIRQLIMSHQPANVPSQTLASAALLVTVLGTAASFMAAAVCFLSTTKLPEVQQ